MNQVERMSAAIQKAYARVGGVIPHPFRRNGGVAVKVMEQDGIRILVEDLGYVSIDVKIPARPLLPDEAKNLAAQTKRAVQVAKNFERITARIAKQEGITR